MAMRGRAEHTLILHGIFTEFSPLNHLFFIMVDCPGHIMGSTNGIELKLGKYIDVNERKCRRQEP